jgi:hypothetical protein
MLDWDDRKARWRQRWRRWQARWAAWRQRREAAAAARLVRRQRMIDQIVENGIQAAVAKTLLGNMSGDIIARLLEELWRQKAPELQQRALAQVRDEHQHALQASEEALRDRYAAQRKALEHELSQQEEVLYAKLDRDLQQEYGDRLATLRAQRTAARARAEQAEAQLVFLLTQLLHEERRRYLADSHIERLDLAGLNAIVHRHGWAIRSAARPSERAVKVMLGPNRVETHHVFWLVHVDPARPPVDEPDEDEPADAPALPPAAEGGG